MDVVFKCHKCEQELEINQEAVGSTIDCPSCSTQLTIPAADQEGVRLVEDEAQAPDAAPPAEETAEGDGPHFSVRTDYTGSEKLVKKKGAVVDELKSSPGGPKLRLKTIRRADCVEVGKDLFDEIVTKFLGKLENDAIISVSPVSYMTLDIATQKLMNDYGVMIVYKR
jgi:DNA-directed RNA polymerase subunit RPC12/RpoP